MKYKGFTGSMEFSEEDGKFFGKVLGIKALISYEGATEKELVNNFRQAVREYLKYMPVSESKAEMDPEAVLENLQKMIEGLPGDHLNKDHAVLSSAKVYLEEYFDRVRSGHIKVLPCGIGDTVYVVRNGDVTPMMLEYVYISQNAERFYAKSGDDHFNFRKRNIGKDVFMTQDEAEAAAKPF